MTEFLGVIASALTIIASLVGGGIWLMKINHKYAQQTIDAKKDLYRERVENLKTAIQSLENKLAATDQKLDVTMKQLGAATRTIEETKTQMVGYVEATEKKIATFESAIVKLSNDLIMLKTKPKG
jgi:archaellum component FlaF (FlaF/FlaG flagellin family)